MSARAPAPHPRLGSLGAGRTGPDRAGPISAVPGSRLCSPLRAAARRPAGGPIKMGAGPKKELTAFSFVLQTSLNGGSCSVFEALESVLVAFEWKRETAQTATNGSLFEKPAQH